MSGGRVEPRHVRRVRAGHGANCSSVGSVIDTLFATAVVGGALLAAVAAALAREPVRVVGRGAAVNRGDGRGDSERGSGRGAERDGRDAEAGGEPPESAT